MRLEALPEDSTFLHLEPPQRRQRTLEALQRLLLRESQVQPLLDRLVERLAAAPLLLLVNYRPEYQHGWGSWTYYTQLRLDPLPPAIAAEVLQVLLGDDASLARLTQILIARTEGNPFFLEESVRTLVETQVLEGRPWGLSPGPGPADDPGAGHGAGGAGSTHRPAAVRGQAPPPDRGGDRP